MTSHLENPADEILFNNHKAFILPLILSYFDNAAELSIFSLVSKDFQRAACRQACFLDTIHFVDEDDESEFPISKILPTLHNFTNIRKLVVGVEQILEIFIDWDEDYPEDDDYVYYLVPWYEPTNVAATRFLDHLQFCSQYLRHNLQHIEITQFYGNFHEFWQDSKTFDVCTPSPSSSLRSINNNTKSSNKKNKSNKINDKYDGNDYGFPNVTLYFFGNIVDADHMSYISDIFPNLKVFDCWLCTHDANASNLLRYCKHLQIINLYQATYDDGFEFEKYIDFKNLIAFYSLYSINITTQQWITFIEKVISDCNESKLKAFSLPYDHELMYHDCIRRIRDKFGKSTDFGHRGRS